jgi:chromosome segregation ATPase
MKNFDLYVGLKRRRTELSDSIETAKKEISSLEAKKEELERELLRLEALGDRGAESAQKRLRETEDAILANRVTIDKGTKAIEVVLKEQARVRPEAFAEIKGEYRDRYEKGLRNLLKKLKEAGDAENVTIEIAAEAVRIAKLADMDEMFRAVPIITHVVVNREDGSGSLILRFLADCKGQGLEID